MKNFRLLISAVFFLTASTSSLYGQSTFQRNYGNTGFQKALSVALTKDGGYVTAGYSNNFNPLNYNDYDGYVAKFDCDGNLLWSKIFGDTTSASTSYGDEELSNVIETPDGGLMLSGYTNSYGANGTDIFVIKTDSTGNITWSKIYDITASDGSGKIKQTKDGNFFILSGHMGGSCGLFISDFYIDLIKINVQGDIIWAYQYGPVCGGNVEGMDATNDGGAIVTGSNYLMKVDGCGNLQWAKDYNFNASTEIQHYSVIQIKGGNYMVTAWYKDGSPPLPSGRNQVVFRTDPGGNIIWFEVTNPTSSAAHSIAQCRDGNFIVSGRTSFGQGSYDHSLFKINLDGNIFWYKAYGGTGWDWGWDAVEALNGGYVMVGEGADVFGNPSILDCMITKTDSAGNCGSCTWTNVNWAPQSFTPEVSDPAFITATLAVSVSTVTAEARNVISMDSLFCQQSYQLTAHFSSTEVCFNDTTRFTGTSLCSANSWFWDFDDPASGTDNTSVLQNPTHIFTTPGTYDVTHIASNGITSDTIIQGVTVYPPPSADAGTDTIICGGNSVQLNGYGGSSYPCNPSPYLWSPGVTLSDSTIANPVAFPLETTMYYLTVRDTNGCISSDSVQVAFSPLSISVSPDVFICEGNFGTASVTVINGNPPYNYSWSNSATSSNITGLTAGSYIVTVTDITGCFQTDSVIVTQSVITATITTTNSDCNNVNGTATISAGGGSPPYTYLWSNSQTSLTATGLATGTYTVTVTDSEGCTKVESFLITQSLITANTTVTDAFCGNDNGTATISPNGGSPPYTYQWSNSLTSSTATGLAAGSYNVTVTDSNNCYQVSSFTVNAIPGPTAEAGPDLTINIGNMATLNAGGGEAYLWNTGDTTATINVSPQIATVYCVTVTDTLGCSGTACVNVFVEIPCPTNDDLSVPNAFSPNNDGNNDDFCLQGWDYCISVFIVYIFDRWGEKVFESSDPEFCWDGTYKGKPMDAAVFVYYIDAVLNNNDKITRTGNISLIR